MTEKKTTTAAKTKKSSTRKKSAAAKNAVKPTTPIPEETKSENKTEIKPTHFLILMRHGKASKDYDLYEDINRPLNKRGKKDVKIMRKQLAACDIVPDIILCSPAVRVTETYQEIYKAFPDTPAFSSEALYQAGTQALLDIIKQIKEDIQTVMIIGHNPGLEDLAEVICDAALSDDEALRQMGKKFPTSAVAVLELTDKWAEIKDNSARLLAFARPVDFK
ncbi:phosphoglycerate mutase family protein [Acetobacter sp. CAG:977]|nr:phosphoglycerate mutase family protein [Acetobacter sp. CAG:977]